MEILAKILGDGRQVKDRIKKETYQILLEMKDDMDRTISISLFCMQLEKEDKLNNSL